MLLGRKPESINVTIAGGGGRGAAGGGGGGRGAAAPAAGGEAPTVARLMKSSIPYGIALGLGGLLALGLEAAGVITIGLA